MSDQHRYARVRHAHTDVADSWWPVPWLEVEIGYAGVVVGYHVWGHHTDQEALTEIVSRGRLFMDLLRDHPEARR